MFECAYSFDPCHEGYARTCHATFAPSGSITESRALARFQSGSETTSFSSGVKLNTLVVGTLEGRHIEYSNGPFANRLCTVAYARGCGNI